MRLWNGMLIGTPRMWGVEGLPLAYGQSCGPTAQQRGRVLWKHWRQLGEEAGWGR